MRSIRHPNLLTFFGAGKDRQNRAFLVTELMARGSLRRLLRDTTLALDWPMRLQFAVDVAAGMRYLHKLGMVHRDLKVILLIRPLIRMAGCLVHVTHTHDRCIVVRFTSYCMILCLVVLVVNAVCCMPLHSYTDVYRFLYVHLRLITVLWIKRCV